MRLRFCRTISHRHVRLTSSPVSVLETVYPSPSQSGQGSEVSSHVAIFGLSLLPTAFLLPVNSATILLLREPCDDKPVNSAFRFFLARVSDQPRSHLPKLLYHVDSRVQARPFMALLLGNRIFGPIIQRQKNHRRHGRRLRLRAYILRTRIRIGFGLDWITGAYHIR